MAKVAKQINIDEAETQFSRLVDAASKGESFVIARAGTPVAKLVPAEPTPRKEFKFGLMKGRVKLGPEFDDPLPDWLLDAFEGKSS
jgi:prevent-host-death family protein